MTFDRFQLLEIDGAEVEPSPVGAEKPVDGNVIDAVYSIGTILDWDVFSEMPRGGHRARSIRHPVTKQTKDYIYIAAKPIPAWRMATRTTPGQKSIRLSIPWLREHGREWHSPSKVLYTLAPKVEPEMSCEPTGDRFALLEVDDADGGK